jgi:hypothetical protein
MGISGHIFGGRIIESVSGEKAALAFVGDEVTSFKILNPLTEKSEPPYVGSYGLRGSLQ